MDAVLSGALRPTDGVNDTAVSQAEANAVSFPLPYKKAAISASIGSRTPTILWSTSVKYPVLLSSRASLVANFKSINVSDELDSCS